ncbi:hypothetical protein P3386_24725 [Vibrio parahaemolyticus]|nr:hypothetical protein [Vibrio parahaemolyticus]
MYKTTKINCDETPGNWLSVIDGEDEAMPVIEIYSSEHPTGNVCCPNKGALKVLIDALSEAYDHLS